MRAFVLAALAAASLVNPAKAEIIDIPEPGQVEATAARYFTGLQYSLQPSGFQRNALYFDLIRPSVSEPTPVVVFIAGSGWRAVERERLMPQLVSLSNAGFAVASIDYRGIGEAIFPVPQRDVKAAVRHLRANAAHYNIDPDRIAVMGNSAGGHLALMAGLTDDHETFIDDRDAGVSSAVQAIVAVYPVTQLGEAPSQGPALDLLSQHLGTTSTAPGNEELLASARPETYASENSPPVLLIHGTADAVVPIGDSERFHETLEVAGVDVTLLRITGATHSYDAISRVPEFDDTIIDFLRRTLAAE